MTSLFLLALTIIVPPALARQDGSCQAWLAAQDVGVLSNDALSEVSGLAVSHQQSDLLWMHNDAGDEPLLYALRRNGEWLGSFYVLGAYAQDWEDLALGPCLSGSDCSCLYIGDFGDNEKSRSTRLVWRVPEPEVNEVASSAQTAAAEALYFVYPDGNHDAEALLVHPETGELLVLTKDQGDRTGVYAFPDTPPAPSSADAPTELQKIATLDIEDSDGENDSITGGVVSPGGMRVFLRSDQEIHLFSGESGQTIGELLATEPVRLPAPPDAGNAEAIGISADGQTLHIVGEGIHATLYEVDCVSYDPAPGDTADPLVSCDPETPAVTDPLPTCGCSDKSDSAAFLLPLLPLPLLRRSRKRALP